MSKTEILEELPKLTSEERLEIRAKLNELESADDGWDDDGELSEADKKLIEERQEEHRRDPSSAISWPEFDRRLAERLRQ